jgi:hypothetical protein
MASCKISDLNPLHRRKSEAGPSSGPWFNTLSAPEAIAVLALEEIILRHQSRADPLGTVHGG